MEMMSFMKPTKVKGFIKPFYSEVFVSWFSEWDLLIVMKTIV